MQRWPTRGLSRSIFVSLPAVGLLALSLLAGALPLGATDLISHDRNPRVTFTTPGTKMVTLQSCNIAGCTQVTKMVHVLDPTPIIDTSSISPQLVKAGKLVRLSAGGHGQPPMTYSWKVVLGASIPGGVTVMQTSGSTVWWDTTGQAPGLYAVQLELRNAVGTVATSLPVLVTVLPDAGTSFYTVEPCRLLDTRVSGGGPLLSSVSRLLDVAAASCNIPAGAEAISANVTVVSPTGPGFLRVYAGNYPTPIASTLNFSAGQVRSNNTMLPLASDGTTLLKTEAFVGGGGTVHVLVDVNGYFQ